MLIIKRLFILSLLLVIVSSCKNNNNSVDETVEIQEEILPDGQQVYRGEFIFLKDAAVLTTSKEIFAVEMDDKMHELDKVAQALKKTEFDMVNVIIHGTVQPNPMKVKTGEGWEQMISIKKIIEVTPAKSANVINVGKSLDIKEVK
jgi:methyl coenzyme M reductase subunit D